MGLHYPRSFSGTGFTGGGGTWRPPGAGEEGEMRGRPGEVQSHPFGFMQ